MANPRYIDITDTDSVFQDGVTPINARNLNILLNAVRGVISDGTYSNSLLPSAASTYSLGSADAAWLCAYVTGISIVPSDYNDSARTWNITNSILDDSIDVLTIQHSSTSTLYRFYQDGQFLMKGSHDDDSTGSLFNILSVHGKQFRFMTGTSSAGIESGRLQHRGRQYSTSDSDFTEVSVTSNTWVENTYWYLDTDGKYKMSTEYDSDNAYYTPNSPNNFETTNGYKIGMTDIANDKITIAATDKSSSSNSVSRAVWGFTDADDVYWPFAIVTSGSGSQVLFGVDEDDGVFNRDLDNKFDTIVGDGFVVDSISVTFGSAGNYKTTLDLSNLTEGADYEDNQHSTNNTQFKEGRIIYVPVEAGGYVELVGYSGYSSYYFVVDGVASDELTGTNTSDTATYAQNIQIVAISSDNYYISLEVYNYVGDTITEMVEALDTRLEAAEESIDTLESTYIHQVTVFGDGNNFFKLIIKNNSSEAIDSSSLEELLSEGYYPAVSGLWADTNGVMLVVEVYYNNSGLHVDGILLDQSDSVGVTTSYNSVTDVII